MPRQESTEILVRIISKGGLIGGIAKRYINDTANAGFFIKECSEQCHNQSVIDFWGDELIIDIKNYCKLSLDN